jgi:hypothetical protein
MASTGALAFRDDYTQLMGRFQSMWGSTEILTDYAICKFLKVTPGQAHLITAGVLFGRRARLLTDLVRRSDDPKKAQILEAFNKLRGESKRDMFAHAYVKSDQNTITFLDRSAGGEFSAKEHTLTLDEFRAHVKEFEAAGAAFHAALGVTTKELQAFAEAALSLSRKSKTSPAKPTDSA